MATMLSTKLTKGGQTTVPKEVREALGIGDEARVWWRLEDGRAVVSAERPVPCEVASPEEFWEGVGVALRDVDAGRVRDAGDVSRKLRARHGLA